MNIEQEGDSVSKDQTLTSPHGHNDQTSEKTHNQEFGLEAQGATTDEANEESEISSVVNGAVVPVTNKKKRKRNRHRRNKNRTCIDTLTSGPENHVSKVASNETLVGSTEGKPTIVTTSVCSSSELDNVQRLHDNEISTMAAHVTSPQPIPAEDPLPSEIVTEESTEKVTGDELASTSGHQVTDTKVEENEIDPVKIKEEGNPNMNLIFKVGAAVFDNQSFPVSEHLEVTGPSVDESSVQEGQLDDDLENSQEIDNLTLASSELVDLTLNLTDPFCQSPCLTVPNPSVESSSIDLLIPPPILHHDSLARIALLKREDPALFQVTQKTVEEILTSAQKIIDQTETQTLTSYNGELDMRGMILQEVYSLISESEQLEQDENENLHNSTTIENESSESPKEDDCPASNANLSEPEVEDTPSKKSVNFDLHPDPTYEICCSLVIDTDEDEGELTNDELLKEEPSTYSEDNNLTTTTVENPETSIEDYETADDASFDVTGKFNPNSTGDTINFEEAEDWPETPVVDLNENKISRVPEDGTKLIEDSIENVEDDVEESSEIDGVELIETNLDYDVDNGEFYKLSEEEEIEVVLSTDVGVFANLSTTSSISSLESTEVFRLPKVPNPSVENHEGLQHLIVHPPQINPHNFRRLVTQDSRFHKLDREDKAVKSQQQLELPSKSWISKREVGSNSSTNFNNNNNSRLKIVMEELNPPHSDSLSKTPSEKTITFDSSEKEPKVVEEKEKVKTSQNFSIIDPSIIEDALTESEMEATEPKRRSASIIKNLRNCFGRRKRSTMRDTEMITTGEEATEKNRTVQRSRSLLKSTTTKMQKARTSIPRRI